MLGDLEAAAANARQAAARAARLATPRGRAGFVLPPAVAIPWVVVVAVLTPINLFQTMSGAYRSSLAGAALKTLIVWFTPVVSFGVLTSGLLLFSLSQL